MSQNTSSVPFISQYSDDKNGDLWRMIMALNEKILKLYGEYDYPNDDDDVDYDDFAQDIYHQRQETYQDLESIVEIWKDIKSRINEKQPYKLNQTQYHNAITTFAQYPDESYVDFFERYVALCKRAPYRETERQRN
ncbi:hypothetical protein H4219_005388, partial [Mycoemilia scoparia]